MTVQPHPATPAGRPAPSPSDPHAMSADRARFLVRASFARVLPEADRVAELFYERLFTLDPALRPMFPEDMTVQRQKLMQTLRLVINGLDRLDTLLPTVEALGRRHRGYGVADHHYETVARALLWTLERLLGDGFTAEVQAAWAMIYTILADTMKGRPPG